MKAIPWYIILALIVVIILQRECGGKPKPCKKCKDTVKVLKETVYVYDTQTVEIIIPVPQPKDSFPYPVPVDVDTASILQAYFTTNYYEREFADSNLKVMLKDSIRENKVSWHSLGYQILRPTEIIEKYECKQRAILHVGVFMSANRDSLVSAGPEVMFTTRRMMGYGVGYDVENKAVLGRFTWGLIRRD